MESVINPWKHSQFSEYQILFSNDLVQKNKKWHDGSCKFFKFNKKLIIYNEQGVVVGTHFVVNPGLLDQRDTEIKIGGCIWVIIEQKLADYERDISNFVNHHRNNDIDNGKRGQEPMKIVNKRVDRREYELEKENIVPLSLKSTRRVGLSRLSSPSYLAKKKRQQMTPLALRSSKSPVKNRNLFEPVNPMPTPLKTPLKGNSLLDEFVAYLQAHDQTPTRSGSKIDVYASDGEQDLSEDVSDLDSGTEDAGANQFPETQTRTYDFTSKQRAVD